MTAADPNADVIQKLLANRERRDRASRVGCRQVSGEDRAGRSLGPVNETWSSDHTVAVQPSRLLGARPLAPIPHPTTLPVVTLRAPQDRSPLYYAVSSVDDRGRIADRTSVRHVGWRPGQSVTLSIVGSAVVVQAFLGGADKITRQGRLLLPARIRHACHIRPRDRLLVAASAERRAILVAHTALLDAALTSAFTDEHGVSSG